MSVPIAHRYLREKLSPDDVILALIEQNEMLSASVMELSLTASKKVRGENGKIWIYHCPDSLLPDPA